jgi:hypothetical protein
MDTNASEIERAGRKQNSSVVRLVGARNGAAISSEDRTFPLVIQLARIFKDAQCARSFT